MTSARIIASNFFMFFLLMDFPGWAGLYWWDPLPGSLTVTYYIGQRRK